MLDARPGFIIKILKRSLTDKFIKTRAFDCQSAVFEDCRLAVFEDCRLAVESSCFNKFIGQKTFQNLYIKIVVLYLHREYILK